MQSLLNIFRPAPFTEPIKDQAVVKKEYNYWRWRIFYGSFIGYALYYFTRKSFTFAMPALIADLGFTKSDLGMLGSILAITYGFSKFASGILGDRSNPRYLMAAGLIITGTINILFGLSSSLIAFAVLWGLNGWFQGFGWPSACRILTHWYAPKERGTWWSLWNVSHNVGGAIIPLIAAFCAAHYGWRYAMYVPGIICIVMGFFIINRLRDIPQTLGLPRVEEFKQDPSIKNKSAANEERQLTVKEALFDYILTNKFIWLLAFSYFCVYIVRTAANDWSALFLVEQKHYGQIVASSTVSWFEVGGFLGSLLAGFISDYIFAGRRAPIMVIYMIAITIPILAFWLMPGSSVILDATWMFLIGFLIFGPQMLIGCAAADLSHKKAASSATGFVSCFAYLGAAVAGSPLGYALDTWDWDSLFIIMLVCSLLSLLMLVPMWNARSKALEPIAEPEPAHGGVGELQPQPAAVSK